MQPKWEREGGWCLCGDPTVGERGPSGGRTHTIRNGMRRRSPGLMRGSAGITLVVVGRGQPIRMARREEHRPHRERLQHVAARLARGQELLQQLRWMHSHARPGAERRPPSFISGVWARTAERGSAGGSVGHSGTRRLWEGVRGRRPGLVQFRSSGSAGCGSAECGVAGPRSAELMAAGAAAAAEVFIIEVGGWRPLHVGLWGWRADGNGR